jgi:hypothetical protein
MRTYGKKHFTRQRGQTPLSEHGYHYLVRPLGENALWTGFNEARGYAAAERFADERQQVMEILRLYRVLFVPGGPEYIRTHWTQTVAPFAELRLCPAVRERPSDLAERSQRLAAA